ncbi:MAG: bifunctional precorrin-2 dehydrogenase/sirohydrochlorin ferrochelatase [Defluviitaleaceae bacterium]|nr:bifunctional precorrin-2 dehydrogenase/sirohydrochlorin ferrochelatase [Defluviitaleaceae bacterium]
MFYPIHLNISDMNITVVGGGRIAYRKCKFFLESGKAVTMVAMEFCPELEAAGDRLKLIRDSYRKEYISDSALVIAATNDRETNRRIAADCAESQKLVNVADDTSLSGFIVPACVKRGDLLICVATGGKSPSLSKRIKRELEARYDESYRVHAAALGYERKKSKEPPSWT